MQLTAFQRLFTEMIDGLVLATGDHVGEGFARWIFNQKNGVPGLISDNRGGHWSGENHPRSDALKNRRNAPNAFPVGSDSAPGLELEQVEHDDLTWILRLLKRLNCL